MAQSAARKSHNLKVVSSSLTGRKFFLSQADLLQIFALINLCQDLQLLLVKSTGSISIEEEEANLAQISLEQEGLLAEEKQELDTFLETAEELEASQNDQQKLSDSANQGKVAAKENIDLLSK